MEQNTTILKRDSLENWNKAKNYIPKVGVIIIVDMPDGSIQLKIGNGKDLVQDLPDSLRQSKRTSYVDNEMLNL